MNRWFALTLMLVPLHLANAQLNGKFVLPEFEPPVKYGSATILGRSVPVLRQAEKGVEAADSDHARFRVPLGKVTSTEFASLSQLLGSDVAKEYSTETTYELRDFLPPMAQALEGRHFVSVTERNPVLTKWLNSPHLDEFDSSSDELSLSTNCWQTTLEYLRRRHDRFDTFYAPMARVVPVFEDPANFKPVEKSQLRSGDIVFIYDMNFHTGEKNAAHAAVYLTGDLFFEKTGADDGFFFRIVPRSEIENSYSSDAYTWQYLRYTGKPLADPHQFAVAVTDPDTAKEINDPLTSQISVEWATGQGMVAASFFGMRSYVLKKTADGWQIGD